MSRQGESLAFLWNIMHREGTTTSLSFLACILSDGKLAKRSIETCDLSKRWSVDAKPLVTGEQDDKMCNRDLIIDWSVEVTNFKDAIYYTLTCLSSDIRVTLTSKSNRARSLIKKDSFHYITHR